MENNLTYLTKDETPLGARYIDEKRCVEFSLYSKNATRVFLCIFSHPQGEEPIMTLEMQKSSVDDCVFKTSVKDYVLNCHKYPIYYGFRVFGPNWQYHENFVSGSKTGFVSKFDESGNRFNPNKIAYDPYSQELSHLPSSVNPALNIFRSGSNFHLIDNAKWAPKSVFSPKKDLEIAAINPRPFSNEIIGEVHLKDLTQTLNMQEHGTYSGAKKFANSVKELGITMIEFLPLNEFDSRQNGYNHWGYMPLGYFSLAKKYAYNQQDGNILNEFREMVDEFHKNGIKVCLDMVYNHTGEAGLVNNNPNDANLLSYALIDNSTYYKTYKEGYYRSNSGCGNDFNVGNPAVLNLVVDSLVFWVNQGVDAFRFDLAAALLENSQTCEETYDSINSLAGTLKDRLKERGINVVDDFSINQKGVVLIAEPWTCGGKCCYQLGNFPSFWAEWNDISRDTIRKITLKPDEITPFQIKEIMEGTPSKFKDINKSINYIASHDGFSLYDLNSYKHKHHATQGGSNWEISGDYGGDEKLRENAIKKQLAILFLAHGIPMIQIGDIIAHTKLGNNNSYNHDDSINYLNWDKALRKESFENKIMEYVRNLINFRKENPAISSNDFVKRLTYHYDNGEIADLNNDGYWYNKNDNFFAMLINGEKRLYIAMSKSDRPMNIVLPETINNAGWFKCLDTTDSLNIEIKPSVYIESKYILNPHALCIYMEK